MARSKAKTTGRALSGRTSAKSARKAVPSKASPRSTVKAHKAATITSAAAEQNTVEAAEPLAAVVTTAPSPDAPMVKKKDFIEKVVERSGIKKKDAKPVIEAMLAELGDALARGETLALRPLGKVKVVRRSSKPTADVLVCKLRRAKGATSSMDPLAEVTEES